MIVAQDIKYYVTKEIELLLKLIIAISTVYLVLINFSLLTLFILAVILISIFVLAKLKFKQLKQEGVINKVSPKLRSVLLQKSIFDIYSDVIYFPTITKIIGAFLRPAISKPHPEQLKKSFQNLPQKAKQIISTKGLIHLFPKSIQQLAYKQGQIIEEPKRNDWSWYNSQNYKMHEQVHEQTVSKQLMENIDKKLSWSSLLFMGLVIGLGVKSMNAKRMKKMMIQNGCFTGMILLIVVALIKYKKMKSLSKSKKISHLQIEARVVQSQ